MRVEIRRCPECGVYTLKEQCSKGHKTISINPPKYSPEDKYGAYRREALKEERERRGLL